jgi:hypothetical protein
MTLGVFEEVPMRKPAQPHHDEHVTERPIAKIGERTDEVVTPIDAPIEATLKESSGLRRLLDVVTPEGVFFVEYNGSGMGYETVLVNGRVVCQPHSLLWFVPRFEFRLGRRSAVIEVRVWPWLRMSSFRLRIDGELVYEEP